MKNHRPDLNGLLILDKPLGWTSADCCRYLRKGTGGAKVGHAGTLDPLATGVLVLCFGRATKLIDSLMASEKRYLAEIDLSRTSPTDDLEAPTEPVAVGEPPSIDAIRAACATFVGRIMQAPPIYSAIWVDGKRSYNLARSGDAAVLPARPVDVHAITIVGYAWPIVTLDILCGKGTYIRSLARDLGRALSTGGVLTSLRRTASGEFRAEGARDPRTITEGLQQADLLDMPTVSTIRPDADADS